MFSLRLFNMIFNKQIQIGKYTINNTTPTFIIAEAGVNHEGSMDLAKRLIDEVVDQDNIAEIVANWTGIPVQNMLQSEREKLLNLEKDKCHIFTFL